MCVGDILQTEQRTGWPSDSCKASWPRLVVGLRVLYSPLDRAPRTLIATQENSHAKAHGWRCFFGDIPFPGNGQRWMRRGFDLLDLPRNSGKSCKSRKSCNACTTLHRDGGIY